MAMFKQLVVFFIFGFVCLCHAVATEAVYSEKVYIDVRSQEEYGAGHIQGALLMPHNRVAELITAANIARDAPIVLYCRSGRRAEFALETLRGMGYTDVTNAGGYDALAASMAAECSAQSC